MGSISLSDVLCKSTIDTSVRKFANKDELFRYMAGMFVRAGYILDIDKYVESLYEREALGSTYMENHLVLPHGKCDSVIKPGVAICRFEPMHYEGEDEELASLAVMLAVPGKTEQREYLRLLASISCSLLEDEVKEVLSTDTDPDVVVETISSKISI